MNKRRFAQRKSFYLSIAALIAVLTAIFIFQNGWLQSRPEPQAVQQPVETRLEPPESSEQPETVPSVQSEEEAFLYPVGRLSISGRRESYVSEDMILEIPRLELVCPILNGTEKAELDRGVGLFEYAQLPGISNSNTSLAGHRDIYGKEFYYIHTITDGDFMYLTYEGKKYTYEYVETFVTDDSDWNPIRAKEFACITLQSCDPIGTSLNRIFVVGRLIDIEDAQ